MLKLVIVMPKINWRFIIEPLVLDQARSNEKQSSGKTFLLGPLVVVKEMIELSVLLNEIIVKYWCKFLKNTFKPIQVKPKQSNECLVILGCT